MSVFHYLLCSVGSISWGLGHKHGPLCGITNLTWIGRVMSRQMIWTGFEINDYCLMLSPLNLHDLWTFRWQDFSCGWCVCLCGSVSWGLNHRHGSLCGTTGLTLDRSGDVMANDLKVWDRVSVEKGWMSELGYGSVEKRPRLGEKNHSKLILPLVDVPRVLCLKLNWMWYYLIQ